MPREDLLRIMERKAKELQLPMPQLGEGYVRSVCRGNLCGWLETIIRATSEEIDIRGEHLTEEERIEVLAVAGQAQKALNKIGESQ